MSAFYRIGSGARIAIRRLRPSAIFADQPSPATHTRLQLQGNVCARSLCSQSLTQPSPSSTSSSDASQQQPKQNEAYEDIIRRKLIAASSAAELLVVVENHRTSMNSNHLTSVFEILDCKVESGDAIASSVVSSPGFEVLTDRTLRVLRFFDSSQCLTLLKAASTLGLPADSAFVMGVTNMIREQLSDLSVSRLMFFSFLVSRFERPNRIMTALRIAIPIIFKAQLPSALDGSSNEDCVRQLCFALYSGCDMEVISRISNELGRRNYNMSMSQAVNVLRGVNVAIDKHKVHVKALIRDEPFHRIVTYCTELMASRINSLDHEFGRYLLYVMRRMGVSPKTSQLLTSKAIEDKWSLKMIAPLFQRSPMNRSFSIPFAEYVRDLIIDQAEGIMDDDSTDLADLSRLMALLAVHTIPPRDSTSPKARQLSDYPEPTQIALNILASATEKATRRSVNATSFATYLRNLAMVGVFPRQQLNLLFNEVYQNKNIGLKSALSFVVDIEAFIQLGMGADRPSHYKCVPEWRAAMVASLKHTSVLAEAFGRDLAAVLGGEKFVAIKLLTPLGTKINYAVVIAPNGEVVACNDARSSLSDWTDITTMLDRLPVGHKISAIIPLYENHFLEESNALAPNQLAYYELLRLQNLNPVCLRLKEWESMLEDGRKAWVAERLLKPLEAAPAYECIKHSSAKTDPIDDAPTSYAE